MTEKASILLEKKLNLYIDESAKLLLDEYCTFVNYPKATMILFQGAPSTNLYFIISGLVRGYYIDEKGNDITKSFAAENNFFSTKGLITNNPSLFFVECLEDCKCIEIPYRIIIKILEKNDSLYKIYNKYIITALESLEIRTRDLLLKNAEERYKVFLEQYPNLEQRVNQKYIASYIGIRTGSLSRIRKKFKN